MAEWREMGELIVVRLDFGEPITSNVRCHLKPISGPTLLEEIEGTGPSASKGNPLVYNFRLFLDKGEEVEVNEVRDGDR